MSLNLNDGRTHLKLSLTRPALERLLGGDTEMEVELRHQIANQFADKHLKPLINNPKFKSYLESMQRTIFENAQKLAQEQIGEVKGGFYDNFSKKLTLTPEFQERFNEWVQRFLDEKIQAMIEEQADKTAAYWEEYINRSVQNALNSQIKKKIDEGVKDKLAAAAKAAGL